MDVIEDLAYPLPVTVICEMLGVPVERPRVDPRLVVRHRAQPGRDRAAVGPGDRRARPGGPPGAGRLLPGARPRAPRAAAGGSAVGAAGGRGAGRQAHRARGHRDVPAAVHRGPRDDREPDRQRPAGAAAPPRAARAPAGPTRRWCRTRSRSCCATTARCSAPPGCHHGASRSPATRIAKGAMVVDRARRRQPRPRPVRRPGPARRRPQATSAPHLVRLRHPLLPGRAAGPGRGPDRARHAAAPRAAA